MDTRNLFDSLTEKEMDFIECELENVKTTLSDRMVGSVTSQLISLCATIEGFESSAEYVAHLRSRQIYSYTTADDVDRELQDYIDKYRHDLQVKMPEPAPMQTVTEGFKPKSLNEGSINDNASGFLPDFDDEVAKIHRKALWYIVTKSAIVIGLFALAVAFFMGRL